MAMAVLAGSGLSLTRAVEMTCILRPTVPSSIDLFPFVEELWRAENGSEAFKGVPYLALSPLTKIADNYDRTVYKWETALVEIVAIAR
jgi:hypothetical protein